MSSLPKKRVLLSYQGRFGRLGLALCVMGALVNCGDSDSGGDHGAGGSTPKSDGGAPDGSPATDAVGSRDGEGTTPDGGEARDGARSDGNTTADAAVRDTPSIDEGTRPDGSAVPDGAPPPMDGGTMADVATPDVTTIPDGGTSLPDGRADAAPPPIDAAFDGGARDSAFPPEGGAADAGTPGTFKLFDQIPQFGIYVTTNPNYMPPAGVLMWSYGTVFLTKLTATQQSQIGSDLEARVTYHAQCDNYDRLGGLFFIVLPKGQMPATTDQRTELVRFITPFSDYTRGALATYVFPQADISTFARTLADPTQDVWVGIAGGSNPYDGDPCTTGTPQTDDFKAVGFKYSLDFVSTQPLAAGASTILTALYNVQATSIPVAGTFTNNAGASLTGRVTVIVTGHGAASGGDEYMNTQDTVTLNGTQIGSFNTKVDCASYEQYSPDGNPGIFRNNNTSNPRNWCPGELVPPRSFAATLDAGSNSVSLGIAPSTVPSGSYYPTSFSFSSP